MTDSMKKVIKVVAVFLSIVLIGVIGFKIWSTRLVKEAMKLEDVSIDASKVEDGIYEGHSELGPVIVDAISGALFQVMKGLR